MSVIPAEELKNSKEAVKREVVSVIQAKDALVEAELAMEAAQNAYDRAKKHCDKVCKEAAAKMEPNTYLITYNNVLRRVTLNGIYGAPYRSAFEVAPETSVIL